MNAERVKIPRALTIAGSDSGGGAGIQADLKTFAALGVYGASAITSITAQNTIGVTAVQDVQPEIVRAQIEAVVEDIGVDAAKTGMLHTSSIISVVAEEIRKYSLPVVVDPVMIAKSGSRLLESDAIQTLIDQLFPLATIVTPNALEAEALTNIKPQSGDDVKRIARRISEMGPRAVVVKGGHLPSGEKAVDHLYFEGEFKTFESNRVETKNTHGTGCSFASAIAASLAKGLSVVDAVQEAKNFITEAVRFGLSLGQGFGPVNPMVSLYHDAERYTVLREMKEAIGVLERNSEVTTLIPESQSNLGMALSWADSPMDIMAIPGRIVKIEYGVKASSSPEFGASSHVARTICAVMRHDSSMKAAMNIRYSEELVELCRGKGLVLSFYDRGEEPPEVKMKEGMSTSWGADQAVRKAGRIPDIIYHKGDFGKEPMITVLGTGALNVAFRVVSIAKAYVEKISGK